jgi:hypothetical protein
MIAIQLRIQPSSQSRIEPAPTVEERSTPKGLNPTAQGRERCERTLGEFDQLLPTPKGLHNSLNLVVCYGTRSGFSYQSDTTSPGWRGYAADPGLWDETPSG